MKRLFVAALLLVPAFAYADTVASLKSHCEMVGTAYSLAEMDYHARSTPRDALRTLKFDKSLKLSPMAEMAIVKEVYMHPTEHDYGNMPVNEYGRITQSRCFRNLLAYERKYGQITK